ncbi:MAG TPA: hypothetical protein VNN79_03985 [Actinomycetota bacterium]|nr:hypothetical protein [Actinomycetota bacterium]
MSTETHAAIAADLDAIDLAFMEQWSVFGLGPGGGYHDEGDLVLIDAPITERDGGGDVPPVGVRRPLPPGTIR